MSSSSEQDLEAWIASRKQTPVAHLTNAVMGAIQDKNQPMLQVAPKSKSPSWLVASGCLFAGVGKLSLIFYLAF